MPLRLNRNQLIELIEEIEAGGGDATELRREMEALGPDQDSRTRTHRQGSRFNNEEEPTTAERLNNRVVDLFTGGLSDDLLARVTYHPEVVLVNIGFIVVPVPEDAET